MKLSVEAKLCAAALKLAAKHGWHNLSLDKIAVAAKVPAAQVHKKFSDKNRLLPAIAARIDEHMAAGAGKINLHAPAHDRLFQVLMARFDVLQENRAGLLAIFGDGRRDPALVYLMVPAQLRSMQKILALAGLSSRGPQHQLAVFGLLALYYRALWCWRKDESRDMARTMAVIDRGLRCADRLAAILLREA